MSNVKIYTEPYPKLELREDIKDYQLARLMAWQPIDSKVPIPKSDFELIKILKRYGVLIEQHEEVSIIGYPMRYTPAYSPKEPDAICWMSINSEILK